MPRAQLQKTEEQIMLDHVSKYLTENKFFQVCKKDKVEYIIPAENILYIESYAED